MKFPSEEFHEKFDQALSDLAATIACKEREGCAELIQQMADAEEDPTRKDLLNDVVFAIRRMPFRKYS